MRYKFGHKFIGNVASICTVPWIFCQDEPDMLRRSKLVSNDRSLKQPRTAAAIWRKKILDDSFQQFPVFGLHPCQNMPESFGMSQPAAALSFTNMMNPHLFFLSRSSFLFFLSRVPCLEVLPIGPFICLPRVFLSFVSVDLRFTKRMTGKSRCEMRGCVYISTQNEEIMIDGNPAAISQICDSLVTKGQTFLT